MELRDGDIELRAWTLDDVPAIVAACNDAEIQHWIPVIPRLYTEADARAFVQGEVAGTGSHNFAITAGGRVVGSIGMKVNDSRSGHVGYWCAPEARGRGVTTRALRLLCKYSLEELKLERLELITDPTTVPRNVSQRRSDSSAKVCCAPISPIRMGAAATR